MFQQLILSVVRFNPSTTLKAMFFCLSLFFFSLISPTHAQEDPSETVGKMLASMKKQSSLLPMLEYVHWEQAFSRLGSDEKRQLGASSSVELKSQYVKLFSNPSEFFRAQMEEKVNSMPAAEQQAVRAQVDGMMAMMTSKMKEEGERLAQTEFHVENAIVTGETAKVKVTARRDGEVDQDEVSLVKVDGRWLLPWIQMADTESPPSESSVP